MKKSECLRLAQEAVINSNALTSMAKGKILRVLIKEEDLALYVENQKEKQEATSDGEV